MVGVEPTILQYGSDVPGALLILYKVELRVLARFVWRCTLRIGLEASGVDEVVQGRPRHPGSTMALTTSPNAASIVLIIHVGQHVKGFRDTSQGP